MRSDARKRLYPDTITFVVQGEPASKARARFTGRGSKFRTFTTERTRVAEEAVAGAYLAAAGRSNEQDVDTAFSVVAQFHLKRNQRRDVDNMLKLVLDGLNHVAWADDSQVAKVSAEKFYNAGEGRTVVIVQRVGTVPRSVGICENCGQEFPRPPSHAKKKFCNADCRREGMSARRRRKCLFCGELFVRHNNVSEQAYCSRECAYKAKHVAVTCVRCGVEFARPRHLNRSGNAYCSPECKANYWRERKKSAARGTCQDCGGPTSKKTYQRCRDCQYAAGGRWAYQKEEDKP